MRRLLCVVTVCLLIMSMFSGCAVLQKLGLQKNDSDELHPVSSVVMNEDEAKTLTDKVPVHLYFASEDGTKLKLEVRYIPVSEAKKSVNNLASTIVKELIKGPGPGSSLKPTIPTGAQLRSPININAGVATVDLTKEFVDKHPGGKTAEQLTIYSIVNSLTELKEVQKVKFTINGKVQKDYKGSYQFDAPFPRSASIISKSPAADTAAADTKDKDTTKKPDNTKKETPKPSSVKDSSSDQVSQNSDGTDAVDGSDAEATYSDQLE